MKEKGKINIFFLIIICVILVFLTLYFSKNIFEGVVLGIKICLNSLIPSMYIFMVIACFISVSKIDKYMGNIFNFMSVKLFKISGETFSIMLVSFIGGYPIGAKIISDKIKDNQLTSKQAQYLLNFCVYCSPAFIISGVAEPLWNNKKIGFVIYLSQVITGILMALVCSFKQQEIICIKEKNTYNTFSNNLIYSVNNATKAMCTICSFVVLFFGIFSLIDLLTMPNEYKIIIKGLMEVTSGCQIVQNCSLFESILIVSLFTSFGGVCVILQLISMLHNCNINFIKFILIRVLFSLVSTTIVYCYILLSDINLECFSSVKKYSFHMYNVSPVSSVFLVILSLMLLLFYDKSVKIKYSC